MIFTVRYEPHFNTYRPYRIYDEQNELFIYFRMKETYIGQVVDFGFPLSELAISMPELDSYDYKSLSHFIAYLLQQGHLLDLSNTPELQTTAGEIL